MKGSPGGILAFAFGALFLALGWTGRYAAVWDALRTGQSANTDVEDAPGTFHPPANQPDWTPDQDDHGTGSAITVYDARTGNPMKLLDMSDWTSPDANNRCPVQMTPIKMSRSATAKVLCVNSQKVVPIGGGQVVDPADYAVNLLPSGVADYRYNPNVKGLFDAF